MAKSKPQKAPDEDVRSHDPFAPQGEDTAPEPKQTDEELEDVL